MINGQISKELIAFLKSRQSKEASFDNPSKEAFVPESMTIMGYTFKIDLDQLKKKVTVSDVIDIFSSNKKLFSVIFCQPRLFKNLQNDV